MDVSPGREADLAGKAAQYRPDELTSPSGSWTGYPDGDLTDTERARKRGT